MTEVLSIILSIRNGNGERRLEGELSVYLTFEYSDFPFSMFDANEQAALLNKTC